MKPCASPASSCSANISGRDVSHRRAKLNTTFAELFDLAWLNRSAEDFVCNRCGHLEWFLNPQEG